MARRRHISQLRDKTSFRRRSGQRPPRSITLVVCEGETEQYYFEAARVHYGLTTAEVIIAENTKGAAPISVVECAEEKSGEPGGYDMIYCVFDRDGHQSFDKAHEKIMAMAGRKKKPLPIEEAISIPCFEVWVLMHFERTAAPFVNCDDVIDRIHNTHMSTYKKADPATARVLMPHVGTAIPNGAWLEAQGPTNNYNPYTNVHVVLQHFAAIADEGDPA